MDPTALKYANMVGGRLERFRRVGDGQFNFRCPMCGDSQTSKTKARGYLFINDKPNYHCFKCGEHYRFAEFLELIAPDLHQEYVFERFRDGSSGPEPNGARQRTKPAETPSEPQEHPLEQFLTQLTDLNPGHKARKYVEDRLIPREQYDRLRFVNKWGLIDTRYPVGDARLVLSFRNRYGSLVALTGRSLDDKEPRYVTKTLMQDQPKVFGWDKVKTGQTIYAVEGPIDSLFLPNCIAVGGNNFLTLGEVFPGADLVVVFDNQPRHREVIDLMKRVIDRGLQVSILPDSLPGKDINEMVLNGASTEQIKWLVDQSRCSGLRAALRMAEWKKIV